MATTASAQRDPRSIVTPDAFELSEALLGTQLAPPGRRFAALMIDLLVIGAITAVTRSFALVLGVVAAGFLMRAGLKRTPVTGSVFGRAMRLSVGCLGMFVAILTAVVWSSCGIDFDRDDDGDAPSLARSLSGGAAGAADADSVIARLLPEEVEVAAPAPTEIPGEVADLTVAEALDAYAAALRSDARDDEALALLNALRIRLAGEVAADTLGALQDRIDRLERTNRRQASDLEQTEEALADATSGGLFNWLRSFVDELGFGFGWASLYLTVALSWSNGQTVGKRMLGLRVLRLDGKPITWWIAFERAGGYAAGFATGLLGFAQVFWDANRQGIHDRIVGTVVVLDKAERIGDWESAL
jgi:uncharacterized RDD family membrane protein YckC